MAERSPLGILSGPVLVSRIVSVQAALTGIRTGWLRSNRNFSHGFEGWESPSQGAERFSLVRVRFLRPHVVAEVREPCGSLLSGH